MVDRHKFTEAPAQIVDLDHDVALGAADRGFFRLVRLRVGWLRAAGLCSSTMNPSSNRAGVGLAATPANCRARIGRLA